MVTSYSITMRQSNGVTYSANANCDGTDAAVISSTTCTVPITSITSAPFLLAWGSSVFASVIATNVYGSSLPSIGGNGAIILTVPDAPVSLLKNAAQTSGTQIGLTWSPGPSNGGSAVLDYTVSSAIDEVTFVER